MIPCINTSVVLIVTSPFSFPTYLILALSLFILEETGRGPKMAEEEYGETTFPQIHQKII